MADSTYSQYKLFLNKQDRYQFLISTIPTLITSTILSPFTRLKVILQVMPCISIMDAEKELKPYRLAKKILIDQGLFSFWRGNLSYCYRTIVQNYSLIFIDKKVSNNISNSYSNKLFSSVISSTLSALFYYPLEVVYTRMTSDMTRYGHKRIHGSTLETLLKIGYYDSSGKSSFLTFPITNYYKGLSLNVATSVTYYSILLLFIKENNEKVDYSEIIGFLRKFLYFFSSSIIATLVASGISYPLDTIKRQIQVNGSLGYKKLFFSIQHAFKMNYDAGIKSFYKGFTVHLFKMVPYSFILHLTYSSANDIIDINKV